MCIATQKLSEPFIFIFSLNCHSLLSIGFADFFLKLNNIIWGLFHLFSKMCDQTIEHIHKIDEVVCKVHFSSALNGESTWEPGRTSQFKPAPNFSFLSKNSLGALVLHARKSRGLAWSCYLTQSVIWSYHDQAWHESQNPRAGKQEEGWGLRVANWELRLHFWV